MRCLQLAMGWPSLESSPRGLMPLSLGFFLLERPATRWCWDWCIACCATGYGKTQKPSGSQFARRLVAIHHPSQYVVSSWPSSYHFSNGEGRHLQSFLHSTYSFLQSFHAACSLLYIHSQVESLVISIVAHDFLSDGSFGIYPPWRLYISYFPYFRLYVLLSIFISWMGYLPFKNGCDAGAVSGKIRSGPSSGRAGSWSPTARGHPRLARLLQNPHFPCFPWDDV